MFSGEEITTLLGNPNVVSCTQGSITYTHEFKKRALELHTSGLSSKEIWRQAGFDISIWPRDYMKKRIKAWKKIVRKNGLEGLAKKRGEGATGRPKTKGLTDADKIKYLELKVKYLQAENDFLAKLRAKRAESNSGRTKNSNSSES
jgi:hypothetical protein